MNGARKYIDDQFEEMTDRGLHGVLTPSQKAIFKMCFIGGMSAALAYEGDDMKLVEAILPAMKAISDQYGGRTIFPLEEEHEGEHKA